jgi:mono/diheme cytochrome c family protein
MPKRFPLPPRSTLLILGPALLLCATVPLAAQAPPAKVPPEHAEQMAQGLDLFRKQVKPLLTERCLKCHGGQKTKGDFDLNTRESLLKVGPDGSAVVAGKAKQSRLVKLIRHEDEPHMPAQSAKLGDAQAKCIADWIDFGAPYDGPLTGKVVIAKKPMTVTD